MSAAAQLFLLSLGLLQVKHFICDFVLQSTYIYRNKGIYGHPAGIVHAGLHAVASLPAVLLLTGKPVLVGAIMAGEFLVHYHIDWLKLHFDRRYHLNVSQRLYWIFFGADQLVHQATYVVILVVLAQAAPL